MIATATGLGPYHPAIRLANRTWVCSRAEFATEDEAYAVASDVIMYLNAYSVEYINKLGYEQQSD